MYNLNYRKELDGLRAIAVFAVILYHSGISTFRNGYLGVDIFFVISGFLITSIIVTEIENKKFSLLNFLERRARRILPLLFFVTLVTIPFASFYLSPNLLENYSQSIISICFFMSNILFWLTTGGYFDLIAELKPLIHTWSLSVEIQFYIIFPFLIILFLKKNKVTLFLVLFLVTILSFFIGYYEQSLRFLDTKFEFLNNKSLGSFYLIFSRAWELLLGSMAYLMLTFKKKNFIMDGLLSLIGFVLIIFSLFFQYFPKGHFVINSLYPCIGIFLLIVFIPQKSILNKLLSNKILVFFGTISFSLYMWHQPIFALIRIYNNNISLNIFNIIVSLLIITSISFFSFHYIENPYRNRKKINIKKFLIHLSSVYFLILCLGSFILLTKGLYKYQIYENMYPNISFGGKDILTQNNYREDHLNYLKENSVNFTLDKYRDKIKILVIGNSKGAGLFMALNQEKKFSDKLIFDYKPVGNLGLEGLIKTDNFKNSDFIINTLMSKNIDNIINIEKFFKKNNKKFFIVMPYPYFNIINDDPIVVSINKWHVKNGYKKLIEKNYLEKGVFSLIDQEYFKDNKVLAEKIKKINVNYLNPLDYICPNYKIKQCYGITNDFEKIYFDNTHTTLAGSKFFGKVIYEINWLHKITENKYEE